jgi:sensitive to high expression protein 9, mitochondrial
MSTWGTWGLMGVNVLLFLVFQILVEPWRRKRLVKGFEEKVKEAIETEAAANRAVVAGLTRTVAEPLTPQALVSESAVAEDKTGDAIAESDSSIAVVSSPVDGASDVVSEEHPKEVPTLSGKLYTLLSTKYWKQTYRDALSDRHVALSQRELTKITIQSAAVGATVGATVIGGIAIAVLRLQ